MSRIRGKNTEPELAVRRLLHSLGYRYRLHRTGLPGTPDLVFPVRRKVVFVHGCFWHGHACLGRMPKSNCDFWAAKIDRNKVRDAQNQEQLAALLWSVHTVWECEVKNRELLAERLQDFLDQ